MNVKDNM